MAEDTWEAEVLWPREYERAKEAAVAEATARVRAYWESKLEQMSKENRRLSLMKDRREAERDSLVAELRLARQYEADLRAEVATLRRELDEAEKDRARLKAEMFRQRERADRLYVDLGITRDQLERGHKIRDQLRGENAELRQRLQALGGGGQ